MVPSMERKQTLLLHQLKCMQSSKKMILAIPVKETHLKIQTYFSEEQ